MERLNGLLRRCPVWPLYVVGLAPAVWLFGLALNGGLGPDPVKALERRYGEIALQLLIAALAVTPLRRLTGISLLRFRRALGLLAFAYAMLHVAVWLGLDIQLDLAQAWADLRKRPHITAGMVGFLLLVPLAITSTDRALRRMGPVAWRRLHLLAHPAALAGAVHHLMLAKTWEARPLLYLGLILLLLVLRLPGVAAPGRRGAQLHARSLR